jgi:hypothetical protein
MRWSGLSDGEILRLAATRFDVFLTVDQSLEYQQSRDIGIAVVTLVSRSIEFHALRPLVPELLMALESIQRATVCASGLPD